MLWLDHGGGGVGHWLVLILGTLAVWGLLLPLIMRLVDSLTRSQTDSRWQRRATARPDELPAELYARGEIDEEEFILRLRALEAQGRQESGDQSNVATPAAGSPGPPADDDLREAGTTQRSRQER